MQPARVRTFFTSGFSTVQVTSTSDGLNVGPDFCSVIGATALLSNGALQKGGLVFDLDDINEYVRSLLMVSLRL